MGSEAGADRHASSNGKMGLLHDAGGGDEYGDSLAVAVATCVACVCASLGVLLFSFFLRASRLGARVRPGKRRVRGCACFIVYGAT